MPWTGPGDVVSSLRVVLTYCGTWSRGRCFTGWIYCRYLHYYHILSYGNCSLTGCESRPERKITVIRRTPRITPPYAGTLRSPLFAPKPHTKGTPHLELSIAIWVHAPAHSAHCTCGRGRNPICTATETCHILFLNAGTLCRSTSYLNHEDSPTSQAGALPFFPRRLADLAGQSSPVAAIMTEWLHIVAPTFEISVCH